ncbi:MAG: hypothetical protein P4M14_02920 [Gammaproteobacteria bacterium]|nr:hypothetical protein [Gammaproteobacteria bacterium]
MITRDDVKPIDELSEKARSNLDKLKTIVGAYQKRHSNGNDHLRDTEAVMGLIGILKSHIKSATTFEDGGSELHKELKNMEKKAVINIGLPLTLDKLIPLTQKIRTLLQEEKTDDEVKLCNDVLSDTDKLKKIVSELQNNPRVKDEASSSAAPRPGSR